MPLATFPWTAPEQARLEELHREGLTCGEIGRTLGRSRNSIIGRLMRTGLTAKGYKEGYRARPTTATRSAVQRDQRRIAAYHRRPKTLIEAAIELAAHTEPSHPAEMRLIGLLDLERDSCRFPIGDPMKEGFAYCGNDHVPGLPYCLYHARLSYAPPEQRRRRHPGASDAPKA